jgi:hypothetical protein
VDETGSASFGQCELATEILVGKPEELSVDGDNIRMDVRGIGWEVVDWMHLAQERTSGRLL